MHELMARLFPICRSITGDGTRETLRILREFIPLEIHEIPSGTKAFDWTVPDEWNVRDAYVKDASGRRVIDFKKHNLHLMGYSVPFRGTLSLAELKKHLYTLPARPGVIPYVTSYYQRRWGFCLPHRDLRKFKPGDYEIVVDATLQPGSLTYADLLIPGRSKREILISTYVCHPSMANNELSGPMVAAFLARHILDSGVPELSYRFVFGVETIGSLVYLSRHLAELQANVAAGFVVTCIGAPAGRFAYVASRKGDAVADRAMADALKASGRPFKFMDYRLRGSDERQYGSPGIDLPVGCLMRGRPPEDWAEYHSSADDLSFVTPAALEESLETMKTVARSIEGNKIYRATVKGEPQLGRRGLYPTFTTSAGLERDVQDIMDVLSYADGTRDLLAIAAHVERPMSALLPVAARLAKEGLLVAVG